MKTVRFLLVIFMLAQIGYTQEIYTAAQALKMQNDSLTSLSDITAKLSNNFKHSAMMRNYLYQSLYYYQMARMNEKDAIFPRVNNIDENYNKIYPTVSTEYVLEMDKNYLMRLKTFVDTHCKYHTYKDADVCNPSTINAIFAED